jgi:hypothetical protein
MIINSFSFDTGGGSDPHYWWRATLSQYGSHPMIEWYREFAYSDEAGATEDISSSAGNYSYGETGGLSTASSVYLDPNDDDEPQEPSHAFGGIGVDEWIPDKRSDPLPYWIAHRFVIAVKPDALRIMAGVLGSAGLSAQVIIQSSDDSTDGLDGTWNDEFSGIAVITGESQTSNAILRSGTPVPDEGDLLPADNPTILIDGIASAEFDGAIGDVFQYAIDVPTGAELLTVSVANSGGGSHLWADPNYVCRSEYEGGFALGFKQQDGPGSNSLSFNNPLAGRWYIGFVVAYAPTSGTITATVG